MTTTASLLCFTGCAPEPVSTVTINNTLNFPVGYIFEYGAALVAPAGAILCDGRALSRTVYAALFAVIGTTYGSGDGSTTFNVPNTSPADSTLVYYIQATDYTSQLSADRRVVDMDVVLTEVGGTYTAVVSLQVQDSDGNDLSGYYGLRVWFVDSASAPNVVTLDPPTTPGSAELNPVTASDGSYDLTVEETGALKNWYLCASIDGEVFVSTIISVGVSP